MQSTFEKLGGTYRQKGDYLLPNVEVPENPAVGVWGQRRRKYLRECQKPLYTASCRENANPVRKSWFLPAVPPLWMVVPQAVTKG